MTNTQLFAGMFFEGGFGTFFDIFLVVLVVIGAILFGFLAYYIKCLRKVPQGTALIKTGQGGWR